MSFETFATPQVTVNSSSWGPADSSTGSNEAKFSLLPYAPFGRSDRLGRAADFTSAASAQQTFHQRRDRRYHDSNANAEFQYKVQEDDFELVDTTKTSVRSTQGFSHKRRGQQFNRLKMLNARRQDASHGAGGKKTYNKLQSARGTATRRAPHQWRERMDRQASVSIQPEWKLIVELDLNKLSKGITNTDTPLNQQDLLWCGFVDRYNDVYEKCSTKTPAVLKAYKHREFYPVTTTDDPVIEKLAIDGQGTIFATDAILAHLMTCPRSAQPWDIVVQKLPNGTIFFDKRDASQFDYLTVNETANNPPSLHKAEDDPEGINTAQRLSLEATMVNQNFTQQILRASQRKHFDLPNPFYDEEDNEGMEPASVGYRYRRFDLGDNVQLVCRTELHGIVKKSKPGHAALVDQYMTAFALNEYFDSNKSSAKTNVQTPGMVNWREKLDSQRGAVVGSELKNNAFKIAKWTAQSILADADQMKIGFVSRASPKNATEHQILGTQFYRPKELAAQITLNEGNMWGIMRLFIHLFKDQPQGKYVIMRDPNKAQLKVFSVPMETFESDNEEE